MTYEEINSLFLLKRAKRRNKKKSEEDLVL